MLWPILLGDRVSGLPWFVVGDFNMVMAEEENRGGLPFRNGEGGDLMTFMSIAGLLNAGYVGSKFTWCINHQGRACIWKRLDRLLFDQLALDLGINFVVQYLSRAPSDHVPLLISVSTRLDNAPKPFRFLKCWTTHEGFLEVVRQNWCIDFVGALWLLRRLRRWFFLWMRIVLRAPIGFRGSSLWLLGRSL